MIPNYISTQPQQLQLCVHVVVEFSKRAIQATLFDILLCIYSRLSCTRIKNIMLEMGEDIFKFRILCNSYSVIPVSLSNNLNLVLSLGLALSWESSQFSASNLPASKSALQFHNHLILAA
jgi:hypothetical protein